MRLSLALIVLITGARIASASDDNTFSPSPNESYQPGTYCQWNRTGLPQRFQRVCAEIDRKNKDGDSEGAIAVETLKASEGTSVSRLYKLCWLEDPKCAQILRSSYNRVIALPHGKSHPMGPAFCDEDKFMTDQQLILYFMQVYHSVGGEFTSIDYFVAYILTFAMPCHR